MCLHSETILRNLNRFRNNDDRFCDVEVVVKETKFKAHRDVLRASSPFFEELFKTCENSQKSIELFAFEPHVFKAVLDFIYSGYLNVEKKYLRDMIVAGKTLEIPEIFEKCCSTLCDEVTVSNVIDILNFATANQMDQLKEHAVEFIGTDFLSISAQRKLLDVDRETFVQILLAKIDIDHESQVFEFVLRWLNHDIEHRAKFALEVLPCVRLTNVPMSIIDKSIELCSDSSLKVALNSLKSFMSIDQVSIGNKKMSLTINKTNVYIICDKEILIYNTEFNKWLEKKVDWLSEYRCDRRVAVLDEQLFLFNLCGNGLVVNLQDNQWNIKKLMKCPLTNFGLCEFDAKLWAFGLKNDNLFGISCYDPLTDVWTEIGEMAERSDVQVVSFEGLIYLVGGKDKSNNMSTELTSYNPATKEWKFLKPFALERRFFYAAILGRHLYIVGGFNRSYRTTNTVERYSFDQNNWEYITSMSETRYYAAVCAAKGLLYVFGGLDSDDSPHDSAESFDPATNKWTKRERAPNVYVHAVAFTK